MSKRKPKESKPASIWMICTAIQDSPGMQDGSYVAVEFDRLYICQLQGQIRHAAETAMIWERFYRTEYSDKRMHWLSALVGDDVEDDVEDDSQVAIEDIQDQAYSNCGEWFELPAGWKPQNDWMCRSELEHVGVGAKDILYQFREKHLDFTFETPTLPAAKLADMLARVQ